MSVLQEGLILYGLLQENKDKTYDVQQSFYLLYWIMNVDVIASYCVSLSGYTELKER